MLCYLNHYPNLLPRVCGQFLWSVVGHLETLRGNSKKSTIIIKFLISCPVDGSASVFLPQDFCGKKIPVPQSLTRQPTTSQRAQRLGVHDWSYPFPLSYSIGQTAPLSPSPFLTAKLLSLRE